MLKMIKEILGINLTLYTSVCQSIQILYKLLFKTYIHRHSKMNFSFHRTYKATFVKIIAKYVHLINSNFANNFRPSNIKIIRLWQQWITHNFNVVKRFTSFEIWRLTVQFKLCSLQNRRALYGAFWRNH